MVLLDVPRRMNSDEAQIKAEYTSSLADLTFNSKPLINVLTMLAEENQAHASHIVAAIEEHLAKVQTDVKLPVLYLIDCIAKNIGSAYKTLFSQNIVSTFCSVFKVVDEKTRAEMFKLRQTWNDIFPPMKLYAIDVQIRMLDPAWPVTAKVPANHSIHFNPKFLKTSTTSTSNEVAAVANPVVTGSSPTPETITMQQQLIQKQKELIELQQKKLELELLQTRVKLHEQLKTKPMPTGLGQIGSQNILLKPEVAKQLMPGTAPSDVKSKPSTVMSQRMQQTTGSRISPVNSALVATAMRPSRDPRLQRQQKAAAAPNAINNNSSAVSSVPIGSKATILESNKVVTNKMSVRDNRSEPRLVNSNSNNKDNSNVPSQSSNKSTKTSPKSRQSEQKSKPRSKSRADSEVKHKTSSRGLVDSPTKSDESESKSPSKSPSSKHKKREHGDKKKESKRDRDGKAHQPLELPSSTMTAFKGLKSSKNRNYMRRNRSPSFSPELNQDIDLRVVPPVNDKPSRADDDKSQMDVDLRQLPAPISKKRPSTEASEHTTKKSKTQMMDVLFGNEDVDLRQQLPVVQPERPPTPPPPPIISSSEEIPSPSKKSNLDAIRAKLANATGRDKVMAKSFRKKRPQEDEDLRIVHNSPLSSSENLKKIIISTDDEQCIKAGTMTKEQEKQLMNKIIAQIERQKLKEAQMKDKEENLQPVSDDEIEFTEERELKFEDKDDRMNYPKYQRGDRESRRGAAGPYWRGAKRRPWENPHMGGGPMPRPGIRPWLHPPMNNNAWRPPIPPFPRPPMQQDFIPEQDGKRSPDMHNDLVVDSANQDGIKNINIDGIPRDIRYYDETAVVFMNWNDPREISFQDGARRVIFDEKEIYMLGFNEDYKEVTISGVLHNVRLGGPSREIFIDRKPFECFFGGPGLNVDLDGHLVAVKLDGPPPQVKIGSVKRTDLVAGKVNLIIDAKVIVPVFLDAKLQKFMIEGETNTLRFVNALKTVLINDVPFNVEFGGLPKPVSINNRKHFIRFSVLPRGIRPGHVCIKDMEGGEPSVMAEENSQDSAAINYDLTEPAFPKHSRKHTRIEEDSERNSNSPQFFQNIMQQNNLDMLSSVMTSSINPTASSGGYQVENIGQSVDMNNQSADTAPNPGISELPTSLNINELFQKLVATGIVSSGAQEQPAQDQTHSEAETRSDAPTRSDAQTRSEIQRGRTQEQATPAPPTLPEPKPIRRNPLEILRTVSFSKPATLKIRQGQLYDILYSGMQCSSCGMRFPPEQSMNYSQHLDWHFRQNRKGKKNIRVAASRRWYYPLSDWKNYEEIEDLEEREKNYFDQQQSQAEGGGEDVEEEVEIPSVPADTDVHDAHCEVCRDKFDQFFNEEKEEWHLRNAIRIDDKTYHPLCYEDASMMEQDESQTELEETNDGKADEQNIPGLEIILDDDDDDYVAGENEEVIIDDDDDSKTTEEKEVAEEALPEVDDGEDDDVILNEVIPEKIEVDDDYDYNEDGNGTDPTPAVKIEQVDDGFMEIGDGLIEMNNGGPIKIKAEPIDPDDQPEQFLEPPEVETFTDTIINRPSGHVSAIDGNEMPPEVPTTLPSAGVSKTIKINISKPLPVIAPKEPKEPSCDTATLLEPIIDPSQPLPPGEEPIQLNIKPALQGVKLKKLPPVQRGSELTGMCSIM